MSLGDPLLGALLAILALPFACTHEERLERGVNLRLMPVYIFGYSQWYLVAVCVCQFLEELKGRRGPLPKVLCPEGH